MSDPFQEHAWVTKHGTDPLLSEAENTAKLIGPPTDAEMESAITGNVANLLTVVGPLRRVDYALCGRLIFSR